MSKKLSNRAIVAKLTRHDLLILHQTDIIKTLEKSLHYIWEEVCTDEQRLAMTMMAQQEAEDRDRARDQQHRRVTLN